MRALLAFAGAAYGGARAHIVRLAMAPPRAGLDQRVIIGSRTPAFEPDDPQAAVVPRYLAFFEGALGACAA